MVKRKQNTEGEIMNLEKCETRIANILAGIDNIPDWDAKSKIDELIKAVELQGEQIQELRKLVEDHKDLPSYAVHKRPEPLDESDIDGVISDNYIRLALEKAQKIKQYESCGDTKC